MKNYFTLFGLIFLLVLMSSCKDDINLVGTFKETAIVYGLLDQADSVHLIKINRAFIGPGNALEIAKIPDSSYFSDLNATIYECVGKDTLRSWILKDTIVESKSTNGTFYAPTEKVYGFNEKNLNTEATYKLKIVIYKGTSKEFNVTGETKLVSGIQSGQSNVGNSFEFYSVDANASKYTTANVIVSNTGNSARVNASLTLNYDEYQDNTLINSVSIPWNTGEAEVSPNTSYSTIIQGKFFYELIRDNASSNPLINKRKFKSIVITLTGGSEDFNNYINANKVSNSLVQTKPTFTNLKISNDNNVVGIFSARQTLVITKLYKVENYNIYCLTSSSIKELKTGEITSGLFFE